ncbi:MAG: Holliday junction resolvase RuvX [Lentisphaerae bacterium]|nr:Holliday junction resolvase RuvX [Lentisphaerota bacterium]
MKRVLAVDYGRRRLGLAVSDPTGSLAFPLRTVESCGPRRAAAAVREVVSETGAARVLVGLPLNMDGSEGPMAREARAFADLLRAALPVPVETWDERLSTAQAERVLLEGDLSRRRRKRARDKIAAQLFLQSWLDAAAARAPDRNTDGEA